MSLHADLKAKLEEYRTKRAFDPAKWTEDKCAKFNKYMKDCGLKACVCSVSGGVDSAVTLALCTHAKKQEGSVIQRVAGLCQPIHSSDWALARGKENITACGAEEMVADQTELHTQLAAIVEKAANIEGKAFAKGQLRSYMRAPTQYYVAQLMSQEGAPCIVMGTGNQDEDGYLAYFCKAGDGVVDVQLISDLHKSEVFKVGRYLKVPENTLQAAPSADLWDGQTDEDELGFTYDFIEMFTGLYLPMNEEGQAAFKASLSKEGLEQFEDWSAKAVAVHKRNSHKIGGVKNL
eukprot:TRINITY_DN3560_c2_g4_i1.p1 TRINITY_DN3560_c2_g4~~TRINITY_DN3560_c2_g4_i1.p1  ORF type:complete len:291 (+),score=80.92 TRINITY_DN3560_c2_g4_i1:57-929(+)